MSAALGEGSVGLAIAADKLNAPAEAEGRDEPSRIRGKAAGDDKPRACVRAENVRERPQR